MLRRILISFSLLLTIAASAHAAGDEAPPWLQQLAKLPVPAYERDVPAVVLLNEQRSTVTDDGRIVTVTTYAVRILLREGRTFAQAVELYQNDCR
jgi:hypothetical protein